ncbi:hypothetical protein G7046_g10149 [Stylonectria norvegica]|nr:hypothetical protein G7046_g10149 [Stylonectria norvegica]
MEQRETPMGILRNLGKVLAPSSKAIASSSSSPRDKSTIEPIMEEDGDMYDYDDDDDLPIDRPRLSLPIEDDDDEDDSDLRPPRLSGVEEENYTVQSVELPRRAISEQLGSRLSRGSFGSVRVSDYFNNNDMTDDIGQQSDFFPGLLEDLQARAEADDPSIERFDADLTRRMTMGRESDFGLQMPQGVEDQTTFLMSEPAADAPPTSPLLDRSISEARAAEAQEPAGEVMFDDYDMDAGVFDDHSDLEDEVELQEANTTVAKPAPKTRKKQKRISRHGIEYPPLPPSFVKRVAQTAMQTSGLSNPRISADTLAALTQASEWFFEQLGDDLGAYADHAKRKTVEESDVVTIMKRQRQVGSSSTLFSLAQKHLPRELLQELRMPVPQPVKQRRAKRARDDDGVDVTEVT